MRRLLVLAAALGIMWGLRGLPRPDGFLGGDPLTLAAIGFVVLAAFTVGELGARLGLPKVTGYIVAGVVLGPQVADVLSGAVVDEMRVFNTLALGLIATTAGLELDARAIVRMWRALTAIVVLKVPLLVVLVGGAFYALESTFPSLGLPPEALLPVALIVAVLGIGTSPAIALAVVNDGRAKGPLTDLLLAIAVVKDLVVVVCLAIALAVAKAMLDPTAHLDAHVLVHVGQELGASIVVGAILGVLLIVYTRFVARQMLLVLLVTILVVAEISASLHLELLLVFIVAGFVVRNFSTFEHTLLVPLERIALPVFVVFFATAGAGVDLVGTLAILPLALTLVVARIVAFYAAGRLGGAMGGQPAAVVDNAWLTWLPQAGVTLGLVLLAAKSLPSLADPLNAMGMALVAIHLLVGPVTLGLGLGRAGEMGKAPAAGPHGEHGHTDAHDHPAPEDVPPEVEAEDEAPAPAPVHDVPELLRRIADPVMHAQLAGLHDALVARVDDFVDTDVRRRTAHAVSEAAARALVEPPRERSTAALLAAAALPDPEVEPWWEEVDGLRAALVGQVQALPEAMRLSAWEAPAAHVAREAGSGAAARLVHAARRGVRRLSGTEAPLVLMAREALEPRIVLASASLAAAWPRQRAALYELSASALSEADGATAEALRARGDAFVASTVGDLRRAIGDGFAALVDDLEEHASTLGRWSPPRYSRVEATVHDAEVRLRVEGPAWEQAVAAASDGLRLASVATALQREATTLHRSWGDGAVDAVEGEALAVVDGIVARLDDAIAAAEAKHADLDAIAATVKRLMPVRERLALRTAGRTFRQRSQPEVLTGAFRSFIEQVPPRLRVVSSPVSALEDPHDLEVGLMDVAGRLRELLDARVPEMCRAVEGLTPYVVSFHTLVAEAVEIAGFGLVAATKDPAPTRAAAAALGRSRARLLRLRAELVDRVSEARTNLADELAETNGLVADLVRRRTGAAFVLSGVQRTRRVLRSRVDDATRGLKWAMARIRGWVGARLEDPALVDRAIRRGRRTVDSEAIRERTSALIDVAAPAAIDHLFADRPVDDRRLFVVHRQHLKRVRAHLVEQKQATPLLALVIGDRGSGRSSLLNVVQLSARKLRVIRPVAAFHDRSGLVKALAHELQCGADSDAVVHALAARPSLVLVDDLERFFLPQPDAMTALKTALELAAASAGGGTRWLVTVERSVLGRLEEVVPVAGTFHQRIDLGPCTGEDLLEVAMSRARLGGVELTLPQRGRLEGLLGTPEESWARHLAQVSNGNLSAALSGWRGALAEAPEGGVVVGPLGRRTLPFLGQLPPLARAALAMLYGWGPMDEVDLARCLHVTPAELRRHVLLLTTARLVSGEEGARPGLSIPTTLLGSIGDELGRDERGVA